MLTPPIERFHLEPSRFPAATRNLFEMEKILKHGLLALGFKTEYRLFRARKILNVGLLDPRSISAGGIRALLANPDNVAGIHVFQLDPREFVAVMGEVYGIDETAMRDRVLAPEIAMFLATP